MAWQRKIPFGYQVQNGRINCQPEEAKFVRSIFSHYLLGSSYSQIADEMARQGVRYHQHTAQWNKHMVKRILENERYLGMDGYPCALPGFVDSKNEEKTERNAGYLVVSHSGGGMLRQGTRKGIRRTPANRGMRAHWVVKGLDISEDVCHGMCP